jgi:hypothetical protein
MTELLDQVERLQIILIAHATNGSADPDEYRELRAVLLEDPLVRNILPRFLRICRSPVEFWQFIQPKFPSYRERREYIYAEFRPLFDRLEGTASSPADAAVSAALDRFDTESVHDLWTRALERRDTDPEGAITLARTLLETVCKHVLDDAHIAYDTGDDLPNLYHKASSTLNIAPSQHSEKLLKQILGGATAVVGGLGALRNSLSDAHGQGKNPVRPAPRHAELAVNLAGAMATFIVSTHQERKASFDQGAALRRPENNAKFGPR